MSARKLPIALLSSMLCAGSLLGASKVWSPLPGPGGGPVDSLAVDPTNPSILYATSGTGTYKSTDQGASWAKLQVGDNSAPGALAVDPANPSIVVSGRTRSTDGGQNWLYT